MIVVLKYYSLLALILIIISCNGRNPSKPKLSEPISTSTEQQKNKETKVVKPENGFCSGFMDSEGVFWFGSNGSGVYSYDGTFFVHFTENDGLSNNHVSAITEDKEGNLWFGTASGLSRFDRKNFTTIAIPQSDTSSIWLDKVYPIVNPNQVLSILQDKNGFLWIGTNGAGVYRYDGKIFTQHLSKLGAKYADGLQHNIVLSITEDLSGNIWFTSLSHAGASRYSGKKFTHSMPKDGLSDDMVRASFLDKNGNIWFGFNGNRNSGLTYFDGKSFNTFSKEDGLCNTNIIAICEDKKGNLWLGSGRVGICIFDGKTFLDFTKKDGQPFTNIQFITVDTTGNILFGGKNGLWRFDGENVFDVTLNNG